MSLLDTIRKGVKIANTVTKPVQATISHDVYTGDSGVGEPAWTRVTRVAVVDRKQRQVRTFDGVLSVSSATVIFLDPTITVKEKDRIYLPDGSGGEVMNVSGFLDKGTGKTTHTEAYL